MAIHKRLQGALGMRKMSTRAFQLAMKESAVTGASTAAVYRYLNNEAEPSIDFLKAAAKILDVPPTWLILGEGDPKEPESARGEQERLLDLFAQSLTESREKEAAFIRGLDLGDEPERKRRRAALYRFARKLNDAYHPDAPWASRAERLMLIRSAGEFLKGVDHAFENCNPPFSAEEQGKEGMRAPVASLLLGWQGIRDDAAHVVWYDSALNHFAQRVKGLGEPRGEGTPTAPALVGSEAEAGQETGREEA